MGNEIHIILASDNNYVQHLGVLLVSIFENNAEESIVVHLLSDEISSQNKAVLQGLVNRYRQVLHIYDMDKSLFADFPVRAKDHITIVAYYRLKIADILPQSLNRIIYLDCDMIVTGSLTPLWKTDLNGYALAAVPDVLSFMSETYERLSLSKDRLYFNSGMLLINLDQWRNTDIFVPALQLAEKKTETLLWHDQDILNVLFHTQWLSLPYRWNVMNTIMRPSPFFTKEYVNYIDEEIRHRVIVHYTCAWKPWIFPCDNPLRFEYYKYLERSPWKGFKPSASFYKRVKWAIHELRIRLGLLRRGYRNIQL